MSFMFFQILTILCILLAPNFLLKVNTYDGSDSGDEYDLNAVLYDVPYLFHSYERLHSSPHQEIGKTLLSPVKQNNIPPPPKHPRGFARRTPEYRAYTSAKRKHVKQYLPEKFQKMRETEKRNQRKNLTLRKEKFQKSLQEQVQEENTKSGNGKIPKTINLIVHRTMRKYNYLIQLTSQGKATVEEQVAFERMKEKAREGSKRWRKKKYQEAAQK